jgi:hypothetical protein
MHYRFAETDEEILACYPVMAELRPHLLKQEFVTQVRRQQKNGYGLACLEDGEEIQAVVGFRIAESLAWGRYLYGMTSSLGLQDVLRAMAKSCSSGWWNSPRARDARRSIWILGCRISQPTVFT